MSFTSDERRRATAWKTSTATLPEQARAAAPYVAKDGALGATPLPFCLPPEHAALSLLPEVREPALALFTELGIPWHAGVGDGPSNHLLSSQVQCVNALGQMVRDPSRIAPAFAEALEVGEVLEIEPGRYLTFEYIGPVDVFGESPGAPRVRGARCTSVDAAFLHRAPDDVVELVLVEWKYTESYRPLPSGPSKDAERWQRYGAAWSDPDGPVTDALPFSSLLQEPLYQLVRQQLLAHQLEQTGAEGAKRVRVVHVRPPENEAYEQSLTDELRQLGGTVQDVWAALRRPRSPERYLPLDSQAFAEAGLTSAEYVLRYGRDVARDEASLLAVAGAESPSDVEQQLYAEDEFDGDLLMHDDGVELYVEGRGLGLTYPFTLRALHRTASAAQAEADDEDD